MRNIDRPVQMIFSFEGLINGTTAGHEVHAGWRPKSYDLTDFDERVRAALVKLNDLGIGGIVVNVGYDDYLDNRDAWHRFLVGVRSAVELGLRIWIYDENGYPSGTAGGKVLRGHPELEAVGLKKMTILKPQDPLVISPPDPRAVLFAVYGLKFDGSREPVATEAVGSGSRVAAGSLKSVEVYFVAPLYERTHAVGNFSGARRYVNLMNKKAVNRFLSLTHTKYHAKIPPDLREHVEAFFTDEPSLMAQAYDARPFSVEDLFADDPELLAEAFETPPPVLIEDPFDPDMPLFPSVPWCDEMEIEFLNDHGYALAGRVPELFAGQGNAERSVRRDFWRTVSRLYEKAFADQMANVCEALGIDCSGHFLGEESLLQQVVLHGDLIQSLKHFHRPGIDLLSCSLELFPDHILTHKSALSASFFGSGKGVMSETSNFIEMYGRHKRTLSLPEIKCVLALQYLLGVRDFIMLFEARRFGPGEYREINDFAAMLVETGRDREYRPKVALYFPIELAWEQYWPVAPRSDREAEGIEGVLDVESEALKSLSRLTTETTKRLFYDNMQYVLCERPDIAALNEHGIATLVYYGPGDPEPGLRRLCKEAGVMLVLLADFERTRHKQDGIRTGPNVVYATYEGFVFAVNAGRAPSFISVPDIAEAIYPLEGNERRPVTGSVEVPPLGCLFLKTVPPSG